jgi:hypothetical protein
MSEQSGAFYVPPFKNVRLVECRDFMELVPLSSYREFFGYGTIKAGDIPIEVMKGPLGPLVSLCGKDEDVRVVMSWKRFDDGHEESGLMHFLIERATESDVRNAMAQMIRFHRMSKEGLEELGQCFAAKEEDLAYIETRFPNIQEPMSGLDAIGANDLYQARLKVLAGLQPKTVSLIQKADATDNPEKRQGLEREAVNAYFAELAPDWTEEQVLAWQRNNPVGTKWMCEFVGVLEEPARRIDAINYELAFNWLRRNYNLLTAEELSRMILIATGQRLMPGALKKRRERLGLTTKRTTGPRPKSER